MHNATKIIDIVAQIYESVAYDDVWEDVLRDIGETIDAHCGSLTITDRKTQQLSFVSNRFSDAKLASYAEDFAGQDERRETIEAFPVGSIKKGSELSDNRDFRESRLYTELLHAEDCAYSISTCFYRDSQFIASISFYRAEALGDFDNSAKKTLGVFVPHLTRAFTISAQTKLAQLQAQVQEQVKNTTATALFLVMENSIAKPMNEKAQQVADSGLVLSLKQDRLSFKNQNSNKRLQALVKQCILSSQGKDVFPGGFIRLESYEAGDNEWHVGVTPYRNSAHENQLWKAKGALVIVRPVEKDSFKKLNVVLSDFYGLTASETEVLSKTISGLSGSEIADELNLSKECVRSRLKKIYQKTGVSNQVQLTHNILEGPYKLANMLG